MLIKSVSHSKYTPSKTEVWLYMSLFSFRAAPSRNFGLFRRFSSAKTLNGYISKALISANRKFRNSFKLESILAVNRNLEEGHERALPFFSLVSENVVSLYECWLSVDLIFYRIMNVSTCSGETFIRLIPYTVILTYDIKLYPQSIWLLLRITDVLR